MLFRSKPRDYIRQETTEKVIEPLVISPLKVIAGVIAIILALTVQLVLDSLTVASLAAVAVFVIAGVISLRDTQDVFTQGIYLMGGIGIIMIGASGFAEVMRATGGIDTLVNQFSSMIGNNRALAIFLMLLVGLIITMGIGSASFFPLMSSG